ncbi:NAD(P)-binding domain-containing protein [Paenibacillus sp. TRM 82003]|uniref:phosphogluconate dehydrogenase C-terminal domain-containing protein n=1 Tax=Kineococcus sp. TRM81007 TaxID=2925831 RepID=UPI001F586429|nr:phosphogluconate dehydrogenase C-terminal domain-containing protein [Kineococcus sp. TRM81007]MCI2239110.1 NAD(P)-binding domain-containing protein [Kineococcus sp. TRM81007]MCI3924529.1 NAD(P)-binding domain-containing protein [Paenibacillus sp. TRM 82003]
MSTTAEQATTTVVVVGAGGKMGTRVSDNLARSRFTVRYCESSPAGQERIAAKGREVTPTDEAVADADVVILAVPDVALGPVSELVVPKVRPGTIVLTLDPAAAYAGLLHRSDDVHYACAHPCHPSVFLERTSKEEWADTFGGVAAPQEVVAALETGDDAVRELAREVITTMYAPVLDVHWVTVEQLAYLEPTTVEVIGCMLGEFLAEVRETAVQEKGIPRPAVEAMLYGHIFIALTNGLRGSNPFSDACLRAMDYGRQQVIREDWKTVFDKSELDRVICQMLGIDEIKR